MSTALSARAEIVYLVGQVFDLLLVEAVLTAESFECECRTLHLSVQHTHNVLQSRHLLLHARASGGSGGGGDGDLCAWKAGVLRAAVQTETRVLLPLSDSIRADAHRREHGQHETQVIRHAALFVLQLLPIVHLQC